MVLRRAHLDSLHALKRADVLLLLLHLLLLLLLPLLLSLHPLPLLLKALHTSSRPCIVCWDHLSSLQALHCAELLLLQLLLLLLLSLLLQLLLQLLLL